MHRPTRQRPPLVQAVWASLPSPLPVHVMVGISGQLPDYLRGPAGDSEAPAAPEPRLDRSGLLWAHTLAALAATGAAGLA